MSRRSRQSQIWFVKGWNSYTTASIHQRFIFILGLDASISYYPKLYLLRSNVDLPRKSTSILFFKSRLTRLRLPAVYLSLSISLLCLTILSFVSKPSPNVLNYTCKSMFYILCCLSCWCWFGFPIDSSDQRYR